MRRLHRLLKEQLEQFFGDRKSVPDDLRGFVDVVNEAYWKYDKERNTLEKSLDVSAQQIRETTREVEAVFQVLPDLFFRFERDGTILEYKGGSVTDLDLPPEQFLGKRLQDLPFEGVAEKFDRAIQQLDSTKSLVTIEYDINIKGREQSFEARLLPFLNDQIIAFVGNITARKATEKELRLLAHTVETTSEIVTITDLDNRFTFVNQAFIDRYGYTKKEILGQEVGLILAPGVPASLLEEINEQTRKGSWKGETINCTKDGMEFPVSLSTSHILDETGKVLGLFGITEDITERKKVEEVLRASEDRYRDLVEHSKDLICTHDLDGRILSANRSAAVLLGYEGLEGNVNIQDILVPEYRDEFKTYIDNLKENGVDSGQMMVQAKSGERRIWEYNNTLRTEGVETPIVRGMAHDVTEQKRIEKALNYRIEFERLITRISTKFINLLPGEIDAGIVGSLRRIGEFAGVDHSSVFLFSNDGTLVHNTHEWAHEGINAEWENLQNLPVDGFPWIMEKHLKGEVIHVPDVNDLPPEAGAEKKVLVAQDVQSFLDVPMYASGKVVGFIGLDTVRSKRSWSDDIITLLKLAGEIFAGALERKRTSEALMHSEDKYRSLVEYSLQGIAISQERRIVFTNSALRKMLGYSHQELIAMSPDDLLELVHPDDRDAIMKLRKRDRGTQPQIHRHEYRTQQKDGGIRWLESFENPIEYEGNPAVLATILDITERKHAEELLKERTEQIITHQIALLELAKQDYSQMESALDRITEVNSETLGVERVAVWLFNSGHTEISCENLYKRSEDSHERGLVLAAKDYPQYFEALEQSRIIAADDAAADPTTREFKKGYLQPLGITSMLDIPVRVQGKVVGIVCHEHTGSGRKWTVEEQEFAASSTNFVALALEAWERQQAEEALRASEMKFRALFEDSRDAIYITNPEGLFLDVNRSALDLFGYTQEEMIGLNVADVYVNLADRERFRDIIERDGFVRDFEVRLKDKHETKLDCLITSTVKREDGGRIIGYQGIIRDITLQKQLEEQLRHAQKMEATGYLAGGIAHDFNNVLAQTLGAAELLEDELQTQTGWEYLNIIFGAVKRGRNVTHRLLNFARRGEGLKEVFALRAILRDVHEVANHTFPKEVELEVEKFSGNDVVLGDRGQLNQAVMNLCQNAAEAIHERGHITLRLRHPEPGEVVRYVEDPAAEYICVEVQDTGVGMDQETLKKIFDPFYTTKDPGKGTGLGLSIAYGIIQGYKGWIDVDSTPDDGTTFTLGLPLAGDEAERYAISLEPSFDEEQEDVLPEGQNQHILVVDDEAELRSLLEKILTRQNFQVTVAEDGLVGWKHFKDHPEKFDLVITDLIMPRMKGVELIRHLHQLRPDLKIIIMTGYTEIDDVPPINKDGVLDIIRKPFRGHEVCWSVARALEIV